MTEKRTTHFSEDWFIRKGSYVLGVIVSLALVGLGFIPQDQLDPLASQIGGIITGVLLLVAAKKTHAGSDSTATDEDRILAQQATSVHPEIAGLVQDVAAQAQDAARSALVAADAARAAGADPRGIADAVVAAIRAEELGEHEDTASPQVEPSASEATSISAYYERQ